jgi:plasmid stabilization system protein ParE
VKLRFTPRATRELAEIAEYLRTRNPSAALAVRDAILRSLQNLTLFPAIGRPQDVQGVRKLVTPKYRYLVYYMIDEVAEEIAILTIQHPARSREYRNVQFRRGQRRPHEPKRQARTRGLTEEEIDAELDEWRAERQAHRGP